MTTQHTPGPWRAEISCHTTKLHNWRVYGYRSSDAIAQSYMLEEPSRQTEADFRLIAAAPDLLEALEKVERCAVDNMALTTERLEAALEDIATIAGASIAKARRDSDVSA